MTGDTKAAEKFVIPEGLNLMEKLKEAERRGAKQAEVTKLFTDEIDGVRASLSKLETGQVTNAQIRGINKDTVFIAQMLSTATDHQLFTQDTAGKLQSYFDKFLDYKKERATSLGLGFKTIQVDSLSMTDASGVSHFHKYLHENDDAKRETIAKTDLFNNYVSSYTEGKTRPNYLMDEDEFHKRLERYRVAFLQGLRATTESEPALVQRKGRAAVILNETEEKEHAKIASGIKKEMEYKTYNDVRKSPTVFESDIAANNKTSFKDRLLYTTYFRPVAGGGLAPASIVSGTGAVVAGVSTPVLASPATAASAVLVEAIQASGHLRRKGHQVQLEVAQNKITNEVKADLLLAKNQINTYLNQSTHTISDADAKLAYQRTAAAITNFLEKGRVPTSLKSSMVDKEKEWYKATVRDGSKTIKGMNGALNDRAFDYHIHAQVAGVGLLTGKTDNPLGYLAEYALKAQKTKEQMAKLAGHREHVTRGPEKYEAESKAAAQVLDNKDIAKNIETQAKTLIAEAAMLSLRKKMIGIEKNAESPTAARAQMEKAINDFLK